MKKWYNCCVLLLVLGLIVAPAFSEAMKYPLTVHVSGAKPGKGQAVMSLFSSPDNYLKKPLVKQTMPIDRTGNVIFHLDSLAPGTYAVSIVYDEDNNGSLNTGFMGIPTESVGFSNNAKGVFGPPAFEKAAFTLSKPCTIEVTLGTAKD